MAKNESMGERIGLPPRPFLFTLDQVASLLDISLVQLKKHLYYDQRSLGVKSIHQMLARNIAHPTEKPDWRILDKEFVRWMKLKGFRYQTVGRFIA